MNEKLFVACCFGATAVGGAICGAMTWMYIVLRANCKDSNRLHEILDEASALIDKVTG